MNRLWLFFCLLCLPWAVRGQSAYDWIYWFDSDDTQKHVGTSQGDAFSIIADADGLEKGLHTIHMQVADTAGRYSPPLTKIFFYADNSLSNMRYWFDDDVENMLSIPMPNGKAVIDVSGLAPGIHFMYCLVEGKGIVSEVVTRCFLRPSNPQTTKWSYWFDDDKEVVQTINYPGEAVMIDVSELSDGFHTIHNKFGESNSGIVSQRFIKVPQTEGDGQMTVICTVDEKIVAQHKVASTGGVISWQMPVESLDVGLHQAVFQAITSTGAASTIAERYFVRVISDKEMQGMKCVYSVDNQQTYIQTGNMASNGQFHYDLDVSSLEDGLHRLYYTMVSEEGVTTSQKTAFFWKTPLGGSGIVQYEYWLNDNTENKCSAKLSERENPFKLISLLPVETQPIRTSCFHFEVKDSYPVIYAKNDFHIRFFDTSAREVSETKQYVDYQVSQNVMEVIPLESGVCATTEKPGENAIKWYSLEAEPGDSLQFRLDRAATVQLFAPSGKEVFTVSGAESVKWFGCHVWEEGTFYVALHDVTSTNVNTISLDYNHIDKYAVLRQDVSVVGNGGCSTITFEGNGFQNLEAVDLFTEQGDSIHHHSIDCESDAKSSVMFDFTGAAIGKYNAVFHFHDEDKVFNNFITVEEAHDIELATVVSYHTSFLRGTSTTYTIKITNKGNMTAYDVPVYTYLSSALGCRIQKMDLSGERIKTLGNSSQGEGTSEDVMAFLKREYDRCSFLAYMLAKKELNTSRNDSIVVGNGYFWCDISPNSTSTITVTYHIPTHTLNSSFYVPKEWASVSFGNFARKAKNDDDCYDRIWKCYPARVEAVGSIASNNAETAGSVGFNGDGETVGSLAFNGSGETAGSVASNGGTETAGPIASRSLVRMKYPEPNCVWNYTRKPDCPPDPGGGGGPSSPAAPRDPNDITGYTAESTCKAVKEGQTDVYYKIEFENDPEFATASAHDIYLTDTLDATKFDLSTFAPTRVKIGDKSAELTGDKNFVTTIDMRPGINAIAQVEGTYDQQNGIAKWHISSLDPMTMEPTTYLMDGVLPVNNDGRGIGEVWYDIKLKPGLAHGTEIDNRAGIVFDNNDVIMTPTWTNVIDRIAPESHVIDAKMLNDSTAAVSIAATDELSGPWRYNVYVQYGDGAWFLGAENVPIDKTASVKVYQGIDHGFYVAVTDSAGNVEQKEAQREYTFEVFAPQVETTTKLQLAEGWNWISQNQNTPLTAEVLKPKTQRILSQTEELYKDARFGWTGDLNELQPTQMYKIQTSETGEIQLSGLLFNAAFRSVPLYEGWNWLGYPVAHTMTPTEALAKLEAEEGDALIGQDGLATFSDGQWTGTLTELVPGQGYLYRSTSTKNLFLNATAQASRRMVNQQKTIGNTDKPETWTVDKRKYPNIMGIVASLCQNGEPVADADEWLLGAFSGGECRGLAQTVGGQLMMNVYGQGGEAITFFVMHRESGEILAVSESMTFCTDLIGTVRQPFILNMSVLTGITDAQRDGRLNADHIYDLQGRRVDGNHGGKGVYIVTDENHSRTQKAVRR